MKKIFYRIIPVMLVLLVWVACKDEAEIESLNLSRQFKPGLFDISEGETSTTITWAASLFTTAGDVEYQLEISKDPTFAAIEVTKTVTEPAVTFADTEIDIRVDYYARVKALGKNGTNDSNWLVSEAFRITGEIFILPIREYDILIDVALIRWTTEERLTKIVLTPQGGTPFEVTLSESEYNAGELLVNGLTGSTLYTAEIFNGDNVSKGSVTFSTKNGYAGSNIIDLRDITGKPKILRDTLQDVPAGSLIWLKRGEIYTIDNTDPAAERLINKTITIMSGPDFNPEFARIHLTTNFNFVASSVIDSVVFRDIVFKGVRVGGVSFDNDYIINSNVSATINKIRLENCKISKLRGTVRLQAAAPGTQVANYFINNCKLDSIREFAVVMASAGSAFANVKITNSTFFRCRRYVNHGVTGNNSLVIENCTFNELPTGGVVGTPSNYFIDFNTFGSTIQIKNCILGKTWIETVGNTDAGGIRAGGTASINVTNTYTLADFVSTVATFQIPGASSYTGTAATVFQDPANGNFKIKDAGFPGAATAGDPSWRQ